MRPPFKFVAWLAVVFTLADSSGPSPIGAASAREETGPQRSARGGALARLGRSQFEVFFYRTGLRVFPQNADGSALDASRLTGSATFYHPNSQEPWFTRPLRPSVAGTGQASESLDLALDLSTVPPTGARVSFEIAGPTGMANPAGKFIVPLEFVPNPSESQVRRPAPADFHGYAPIGSTSYYYPLAGYYSTPSGVVWVPAPGYYHVGPSTQYYRPGAYLPPADWGRAHPAPSPTPYATPSMRPDLSGIHTEYYWHPRWTGEPPNHEAWIRGQLSEVYGPGRGP